MGWVGLVDRWMDITLVKQDLRDCCAKSEKEENPSSTEKIKITSIFEFKFSKNSCAFKKGLNLLFYKIIIPKFKIIH